MLPGECRLTSADAEELASHIRECYSEEGIAACELASSARRDVHDDELWIAIRDRATGRIVASGIGEFDARIGEGILDWIQVSPDYRHRGLGRAVVCEMIRLIRRLSKKVSFVTVSGRLNNPDNPFVRTPSGIFLTETQSAAIGVPAQTDPRAMRLQERT